MTLFGLPQPMLLVFVATIVAGSIGAVHYLIVHVWLGRPFEEIPPPVMQAEVAADEGAHE